MAGVSFKIVKDWVKTKKYLHDMESEPYLKVLDRCGQMGVEALRANTPVDSGKTAASWSYKVERSLGRTTIVWFNSNILKNGQPLAIMLQYGHGTGTGGYVMGRDYINPALRPVFDDILDRVWRVVTQR